MDGKDQKKKKIFLMLLPTQKKFFKMYFHVKSIKMKKKKKLEKVRFV